MNIKDHYSNPFSERHLMVLIEIYHVYSNSGFINMYYCTYCKYFQRYKIYLVIKLVLKRQSRIIVQSPLVPEELKVFSVVVIEPCNYIFNYMYPSRFRNILVYIYVYAQIFIIDIRYDKNLLNVTVNFTDTNIYIKFQFKVNQAIQTTYAIQNKTTVLLNHKALF